MQSTRDGRVYGVPGATVRENARLVILGSCRPRPLLDEPVLAGCEWLAEECIGQCY